MFRLQFSSLLSWDASLSFELSILFKRILRTCIGLFLKDDTNKQGRAIFQVPSSRKLVTSNTRFEPRLINNLTRLLLYLTPDEAARWSKNISLVAWIHFNRLFSSSDLSSTSLGGREVAPSPPWSPRARRWNEKPQEWRYSIGPLEITLLAKNTWLHLRQIKEAVGVHY